MLMKLKRMEIQMEKEKHIKKLSDIDGHSETKIEKKNDKGNLLGSEIDHVAPKKEQNKVESR